jgi:hypothetical protein
MRISTVVRSRRGVSGVEDVALDLRFLLALAMTSLVGGAGLLYADAGLWARGWHESDYPVSLIIGPASGDDPYLRLLYDMPGGYCLMILGILLLLSCVIMARRSVSSSDGLERLGTTEHHGLRRRR